MRYFSVAEIAKKWDVSERSVRNYCAHGRVSGAFLTGKTWNIPENAQKPERSNKKKEKPTTLLDILQDEKANKYCGGIYHKTQIDLTYNSCLLIKQISVVSNSYICSGHAKIGTDEKEHKVFASES